MAIADLTAQEHLVMGLVGKLIDTEDKKNGFILGILLADSDPSLNKHLLSILTKAGIDLTSMRWASDNVCASLRGILREE